jgi:crossover junction endodeoxyribonuclease RuvC
LLNKSILSDRIIDKNFDKIVLGIDPGTNLMGYGVVGSLGNQFHLISMGAIQLGKYENHAMKLRAIFERITGIIESYHPDEVALEAPFFGKNVQSMLKLGRAQGVAMAAALNRNVPICEYAPKRVKQAITGSGNASKEQVAAMVKNLLNLKEESSNFDATDAAAVALCHFFQAGKPVTSGKSHKSWESFLKANPGRKK